MASVEMMKLVILMPNNMYLALIKEISDFDA